MEATNVTKQKRDEMIEFLEELKKKHSDDSSIRAFNEIENALTEKKFGLVFEEHTEEVDERLLNEIPVFCADESRKICKDKKLPYNFIIEGDNLQALYLLEKTHRGKVDCIYIDPPYNTGARDWKYNNDYVDSNDNYRHSKWLSMMKTRLLVAKKILNPSTGVLIVTIDEREMHHLKCLLEELFPEAFIQMVTDVINYKGVTQGRLARVEEYIIYCFMPNASPSKWYDDMLGDESQDNEIMNDETVVWASLLRRGSNSRRVDRPNLCYPILVDKINNKVVRAAESWPLEKEFDFNLKIDGYDVAWPIRTNMSDGHWSISNIALNELIKKGYVSLGKYDEKRKTWAIKYLFKKQQEQIENGEIKIIDRDNKTGVVNVAYNGMKNKLVRTVWNRKSHNAGTYGTDLIAKILGKSNMFTFPKSLYAEHDAIGLAVKDNKDAIIVDFFSGSGTTQHAINLLNEEDNGRRKCIMVTNNEISVEEEKKLKEKGIHKGDTEWEDLGIAKHVTWPRTLYSIMGTDINNKPLVGNYLINDINGKPIPMSKGFECNVKYFKCDWTPRRPENYLLSNALTLHIKEMIELENAIEVDNIETVIIYNRDDFNKFIMNEINYSKIKKLWVNQNIIFNSEELKMLNKKEFKYIPREYFGQELKEASE